MPKELLRVAVIEVDFGWIYSRNTRTHEDPSRAFKYLGCDRYRTTFIYSNTRFSDSYLVQPFHISWHCSFGVENLISFIISFCQFRVCILKNYWHWPPSGETSLCNAQFFQRQLHENVWKPVRKSLILALRWKRPSLNVELRPPSFPTIPPPPYNNSDVEC